MTQYTPERRREYEKQRYDERKAHFIDFLGGECAKCGSTDELEFDHKDPSTKEYTVTVMFSTRSLEAIESEVRKCQLLCAECHLEKSTAESKGRKSWNAGTAKQHGSYHGVYVLKCSCSECEEYRVNRCVGRGTKREGLYSRDLVHGTYGGYQKEKRRGLEHCDACTEANREYARKMRERKRL